MINLDEVKPGDVLIYRGRKCRVKRVSLQRNTDLTTEVTGIWVKMMDDYSEPHICPSGFGSLREYEERETTKFIVTAIESIAGSTVFTVGKIYEFGNGFAFKTDSESVLGSVEFPTFSSLKAYLKRVGVEILEVVE